MSYTFGIWRHNLSDSPELDDIQQHFDDSWEADSPPDAEIEELIKAVSTVFPEDFDEGGDSLSQVWDATPLIEQAKGSTFYPGLRLSLSDEVIEQVFQCLLSEARRRGFHLIDWQTEEVFYPTKENP